MRIQMQTKKYLIEENKKLSDNVYWNNRNFNELKEKGEEKERVHSLEIEKARRDSADKSRLLKLIVEILAGEASPTSKTEVLIDLLPEVKQRIEDTEGRNARNYDQPRWGRF